MKEILFLHLFLINCSVGIILKVTHPMLISRGKVLYEEASPSRLACAQKGLFYKGDAVYENGRCSVVEKDDQNSGETLKLKGEYLHKMGDLDKISLPVDDQEKLKMTWELAEVIIGEKIAPTANKLIKYVAPLPDEYKLSSSIFIKTYPSKHSVTGFFQLVVHDKNKALQDNYLKMVLLRGSNKLEINYRIKPAKGCNIDTKQSLPLKQWCKVSVIQVRKGLGYEISVYLNEELQGACIVSRRQDWRDGGSLLVYRQGNVVDGYIEQFTLYKKKD